VTVGLPVAAGDGLCLGHTGDVFPHVRRIDIAPILQSQPRDAIDDLCVRRQKGERWPHVLPVCIGQDQSSLTRIEKLRVTSSRGGRCAVRRGGGSNNLHVGSIIPTA